MAHYRSRRRSRPVSSYRPLVGFLLIASFGILFAGCSDPQEIPQADEFSFTAEDVARFRELIGNTAGTGTSVPSLALGTGTGATNTPVVDLSLSGTYTAIRDASTEGENDFRVTNEFLNVRAAPNVTSAQVGRLLKGEKVEVIEFVDAAWAKIRIEGGEGYVSNRYIAKLVSEEEFSTEKAKYEGRYFVDFGFLNVRKSADSNSEKIGEIPGQTFVRPLSQDNVWARVPFAEGEGYVAVQYLSPFLPNLLVRQSTFPLPVLQYRADMEGSMDAFVRHVDRLKQEGFTLWTLRDFYNVLLQQQDRDVRVPPKTVVFTIANITSDSLQEVTDVLRASGVSATLFLQTQYVGAGGISQAQLQTLVANGNDIQSGGHTGDDLRSLTNAQIDLELKQSRALLEDATGRTVYAIGYPIGGMNDRITGLANDAGYLLGVGAEARKSFKRSELLRMPSFVVRPDQTSDDIVGLVSGG